ncbi:MAG: GntR family transcriptional regulator [Firmicutes bacterium]|nr:GntR family transcriptional regulator [Bacillota bacterium]
MSLIPIKKSRSVTQKAYERLLEAIMSLTLPPGQLVSENNLAEQLMVSRTPVREALKRLEQEGLVQTTPQKGTEVLKLSAVQLIEAAELRRILELWAAVTAVDKLDGDDLERMWKAQQTVRDAFMAQDYVRLLEWDASFHEVFLQAAGNSRVVQTVNLMNFQIWPFRLLWLRTGKGTERMLAEHEDLVRALEGRELSVLATIMRKHIGCVELIPSVRSVWPDYFE